MNCEYCTAENPRSLICELFSDSNITWIKYVEENKYIPTLRVNNEYCKINFCPMCGRKLIDPENKDIRLCINLPINVGDTVYRLVPKLYKSYTENTVKEIIIKNDKIVFKTDNGIEWDINEIGKTIFLNKDEADQKINITN